ncbi:MAG TPA: hypothetical protein VMU61_09965 [Candidatus Aquilonibacter sp.]|nr:hypothetical protein [Candidatus Aquilonibacter sp.]
MAFYTAIAACVVVGAAAAVPGPSSQPPPAISPIELVRASVANEVAASNDASVKHMFRSRKQTRGGSQTRLYVETCEAMAGMTIAYNDTPLSPQQMQGEHARLDGLAHNPDELARKHSQEKIDADRTLRIVKALPDAFLYEYDGTQAGTSKIGKKGDELVRLKFRPNPAYLPPSHVEQVLEGMQGFVLIDRASRRIAQIDGTLFKDVSFGWGFLGHLDKGGHFGVEQAALGDGSWEITRMQLSFTGRILLFKSLNFSSEEVLSDFRRVPADTTFSQGVAMLKTEESRLAQNPNLAVSESHR